MIERIKEEDIPGHVASAIYTLRNTIRADTNWEGVQITLENLRGSALDFTLDVKVQERRNNATPEEQRKR